MSNLKCLNESNIWQRLGHNRSALNQKLLKCEGGVEHAAKWTLGRKICPIPARAAYKVNKKKDVNMTDAHTGSSFFFFGLRLDSREICMAGCCRIFIPVLNLSGWCCISFGFDIDSMVFTCGRKTFSSISYPGRSISRRFAVLATIIRYHFPFVLSKTTILYIGFVVIFHVAVVLLDVKSTSLIPERMKNRNHLFPAFHSALVSMFHRCATSVIDVNCTLSWILVTIMKSCNQQVEMACSGSLLFQYHFHFIEIIFHFCRA